MYQAYPGGDQPPEVSGQPASPTPHSVTRAAQVMYVGAAANLIGIVITLTTSGSLRSQLLKRRPNLTSAQLASDYHLAIGASIASGLIAAALWIWLAQSSKAGKGWARTVSTVLFAIDTIGALVSFGGASALSGGGAARIYGLVVWVIGLVAIILLWQRASSDYFKSVPPGY